MRSRIKVIVTGHVIETYHYEKDLKIGSKSNSKNFDPETGEIVVSHNIPSKEPDQIRLDNCRRARNELKRLITANFDEGGKFLTLTFRNGSVKDVTDVAECNKVFTEFIRRMKYKHGDFKYVTVIEFQDTNGRGAVHYHMISDLKYIPHEEITNTWDYGMVWINQIQHVDNVGAYITAYMTKDNLDSRLRGKKAYMTSRGLTRPVVLYGKDAQEIEDKYCKDKEKVFTNSYISEHQGETIYSEYNPKRSITQNEDKHTKHLDQEEG